MTVPDSRPQHSFPEHCCQCAREWDAKRGEYLCKVCGGPPVSFYKQPDPLEWGIA